MNAPLNTSQENFDTQKLFSILEKKLQHDPKGWALIQVAWDAPTLDEEYLAFQEAAWRYRVGILREKQPKRARVTPSSREANLNAVGDATNKLLEKLKSLDRVSSRMCVPPEDEKTLLAHLESLAKNAHQGAAESASEKATPNGTRPTTGKRNLLLESLLMEIGTIILSRNGSVKLVKEVARVIHWWANGRARAVEGVPRWHFKAKSLPEFGEAPWERVRPMVRERLRYLSGLPEDR